MKILLDFDGVLTEQTEEGQRAQEIFSDELASLTRLSDHDIQSLISEVEKELTQKPNLHGWKWEGKVSSFVNEDLFSRNAGIAACLDDWSQSEDHPRYKNLSEIRQLLNNEGHQSFQDLARWAFQKMVRETQEGRHTPLDPKTPQFLRKLIEAGHEIVIVSNSATDRIRALLAKENIQTQDHDYNPHGKVRVRGGARKYALGETSRTLDFEAYHIEIDRPSYEMILREEEADVIIGDVFSLDLALPYHLAQSEPEKFGKMKLFLRTRHYTPEWSIDLVLQNPSGSKHKPQLGLLKNLDELSGEILKTS